MNDVERCISEWVDRNAALQAALDAERGAKEAYQSTVVDLCKELATLQAQLRQVVGERDEAQLYLTQERANKDSLAACVDRDVQKIKDLQAVLAVVRAKAKSDKEIYFAHIADLQSQLAQRSDERDRLRSALETVKYELAALFPVPSNPTLGEAMTVCGNKNEADARCIYLAYVAARAALTPAAGGTRHG